MAFDMAMFINRTIVHDKHLCAPPLAGRLMHLRAFQRSARPVAPNFDKLFFKNNWVRAAETVSAVNVRSFSDDRFR